MASQKRVAILISGRGSNMAALIKSAEQENFPAKIVAVISNKADAAGLDIAKQHGIATHIVRKADHDTKEEYDRALDHILTEAQTDFICLAGFMRLLSGWFCDKWDRKLINIHPSLLPSFKGLDTHQRALDAGVKFSGCTVHYVTAGMDEGPIIAQAAVPVYKEDNADILAERIIKCEHRLYSDVLYNLCLDQEKDASFFSEERVGDNK